MNQLNFFFTLITLLTSLHPSYSYAMHTDNLSITEIINQGLTPLAKQLHDLEKNLQSLKNNLTTLKTDAAAIQEKDSPESLKQQLAEQNKELAEQKKQAEALAQKLQEAEELKQTKEEEISNLNKELAQKEAEIIALQNTSTTSTDPNEVVLLKQQLEEAKKELENNLATAQKELETVKDEVDENTTLLKKLTLAQEHNQTVQENVLKLKAELTQKEAEIKTLQETSTSSTDPKEVGPLKKQLETAQMERDNLQQQQTALNNELATARQQLATAQKYVDENNTLQEKNTALQEQLIELQKTQAATTKGVEDPKIKQLEAELLEAKAALLLASKNFPSNTSQQSSAPSPKPIIIPISQPDKPAVESLTFNEKLNLIDIKESLATLLKQQHKLLINPTDAQKGLIHRDDFIAAVKNLNTIAANCNYKSNGITPFAKQKEEPKELNLENLVTFIKKDLSSINELQKNNVQTMLAAIGLFIESSFKKTNPQEYKKFIAKNFGSTITNKTSSNPDDESDDEATSADSMINNIFDTVYSLFTKKTAPPKTLPTSPQEASINTFSELAQALENAHSTKDLTLIQQHQFLITYATKTKVLPFFIDLINVFCASNKDLSKDETNTLWEFLSYIINLRKPFFLNPSEEQLTLSDKTVFKFLDDTLATDRRRIHSLKLRYEVKIDPELFHGNRTMDHGIICLLNNPKYATEKSLTKAFEILFFDINRTLFDQTSNSSIKISDKIKTTANLMLNFFKEKAEPFALTMLWDILENKELCTSVKKSIDISTALPLVTKKLTTQIANEFWKNKDSLDYQEFEAIAKLLKEKKFSEVLPKIPTDKTKARALITELDKKQHADEEIQGQLTAFWAKIKPSLNKSTYQERWQTFLNILDSITTADEAHFIIKSTALLLAPIIKPDDKKIITNDSNDILRTFSQAQLTPREKATLPLLLPSVALFEKIATMLCCNITGILLPSPLFTTNCGISETQDTRTNVLPALEQHLKTGNFSNFMSTLTDLLSSEFPLLFLSDQDFNELFQVTSATQKTTAQSPTQESPFAEQFKALTIGENQTPLERLIAEYKELKKTDNDNAAENFSTLLKTYSLDEATSEKIMGVIKTLSMRPSTREQHPGILSQKQFPADLSSWLCTPCKKDTTDSDTSEKETSERSTTYNAFYTTNRPFINGVKKLFSIMTTSDRNLIKKSLNSDRTALKNFLTIVKNRITCGILYDLNQLLNCLLENNTEATSSEYAAIVQKAIAGTSSDKTTLKLFLQSMNVLTTFNNQQGAITEPQLANLMKELQKNAQSPEKLILLFNSVTANGQTDWLEKDVVKNLLIKPYTTMHSFIMQTGEEQGLESYVNTANPVPGLFDRDSTEILKIIAKTDKTTTKPSAKPKPVAATNTPQAPTIDLKATATTLLSATGQVSFNNAIAAAKATMNTPDSEGKSLMYYALEILITNTDEAKKQSIITNMERLLTARGRIEGEVLKTLITDEALKTLIDSLSEGSLKDALASYQTSRNNS